LDNTSFSLETTLFNLSNFLVGSGGNLKQMLQKLHEGKLAPHKDRLEKKYYGIVHEESLEGKKILTHLHYNNFFMHLIVDPIFCAVDSCSF
jgi:hypothetical protein